MKRRIATLVDYDDTDDEDDKPQLPAEQFKLERELVTTKKRKLPPVSSLIAPPGPVDDPNFHQGRTRTSPHVDGQFAAHVYVSLGLNRHSILYKVVQDILSDAKKDVPILLDIATASEGSQRVELHISLSRPIFLRAHQREDLKRAVKGIAKAHKSFSLSFSVLSELINDEKTRAFLTMEVGAGYHELRMLSTALGPALRSIRQQEYYQEPKFHASIGWALLKVPSMASVSQAVLTDSIGKPDSLTEADGTSVTGPVAPQDAFPRAFPTIPQLPSEMIVALNTKYGSTLSSPKVGCFDVEAIFVKIGKDVSSWRFTGL